MVNDNSKTHIINQERLIQRAFVMLPSLLYFSSHCT